MQIYRDLNDYPSSATPLALSIGNFDGMHLGHRAIIDKLQKNAAAESLPTAVLSFENHPREVLHGTQVQRLCREAQKARWLEELGVDHLFLIPFTIEFSEQTPEVFLQRLQERVPFRQLMLGHDARLGKDRAGTPEVLQQISATLDFTVEYMEALHVKGEIVSSSHIRQLIREGDLEAASTLLGHPYRMMGQVLPGAGRGQGLGFPTLNVDVAGLCQPPLGVYSVTLKIAGETRHAIANLGMAPTIQENRDVRLEVHLLDWEQPIQVQELEATLHQFIRPETRFNSAEELRHQIEEDIAAVRHCLTEKSTR